MALTGAIELPGGGLVRGRGLREPCPDEPGFGLYLGTGWVRAHYRPRAVETPGQRRWVAGAFS